MSIQEQSFKAYVSSMDEQYRNEGRTRYEFQPGDLKRDQLCDIFSYLDESYDHAKITEQFYNYQPPFDKIILYPLPTDTNFITRCGQFGIIQS